ncbi:MAG: hypothetical protein ACHP84_13010, partial [Caulobacterales bacterium]
LRQPVAVRREAQMVKLPGDEPAGPAIPTSAVVARIARLSLEGDADMLDHRPTLAAKAFSEAADLQDARLALSVDPPRWWYPARRSVAAALLAEGDAVGAEREASTVLRTWRLDPLTLAIRARAERKLHALGASEDMLAARAGWYGDARELRAGELS